MKNDHRESVEPDTFFEKIEKATPAQVSHAIIAKIMQLLTKTKISPASPLPPT